MVSAHFLLNVGSYASGEDIPRLKKKPERSSSCSQQPTSGPYPKSYESNFHLLRESFWLVFGKCGPTAGGDINHAEVLLSPSRRMPGQLTISRELSPL